MDIAEVPPDKNIVISKVEFVYDIIDESIPKLLLQIYNNFLILSAPSRSGKSTWFMKCLCKQGKVFNKTIDLVYVVCPRLQTSTDNPFECLPPDQIEKWVNGRISRNIRARCD